jgi:hypothetical protein
MPAFLPIQRKLCTASWIVLVGLAVDALFGWWRAAHPLEVFLSRRKRLVLEFQKVRKRLVSVWCLLLESKCLR